MIQKKRTFEEVLKELYELSQDIDMNVYFNDDSENFRGIVIGTDEFFEDVVDSKEDFDNYNKVTGVQYVNKREDLH